MLGRMIFRSCLDFNVYSFNKNGRSRRCRSSGKLTDTGDMVDMVDMVERIAIPVVGADPRKTSTSVVSRDDIQSKRVTIIPTKVGIDSTDDDAREIARDNARDVGKFKPEVAIIGCHDDPASDSDCDVEVRDLFRDRLLHSSENCSFQRVDGDWRDGGGVGLNDSVGGAGGRGRGGGGGEIDFEMIQRLRTVRRYPEIFRSSETRRERPRLDFRKMQVSMLA